MPRIKTPHRWSSTRRAALWGIYCTACCCFARRVSARTRRKAA